MTEILMHFLSYLSARFSEKWPSILKLQVRGFMYSYDVIPGLALPEPGRLRAFNAVLALVFGALLLRTSGFALRPGMTGVRGAPS